MVDIDELKDALEERKSAQKSTKSGEPSTHYFRFEGEPDLTIWEALVEAGGTRSPSALQTKVAEFLAENMEDFEEFCQ